MKFYCTTKSDNIQRLTVPNVDEGVEKLEYSYTADRKVFHFGKQFGSVL